MPKGRRKTLKGRAAWRKIDISDIRDGAMKKTDDMLAGRAGDANSTESLFTIEKAKPKRTFYFISAVPPFPGYPISYNNDPMRLNGM